MSMLLRAATLSKLIVPPPTQVLLLEESGYLGYVDGLTTKKCFAPNLVMHVL